MKVYILKYWRDHAKQEKMLFQNLNVAEKAVLDLERKNYHATIVMENKCSFWAQFYPYSDKKYRETGQTDPVWQCI